MILVITKSKNPEEFYPRKYGTPVNLFFLTVLLLLPIILGVYFQKSQNIMIKIISTIIWQFIFSGFGEELRFRAYYQSIINLEYRRPYEILNVSFGPGLLIGTFFFGISHIFNSYSPFEGIFNLSWGGGFWTFAAGLFCGFLKEKTKNIIAPGIAHGYNVFGEALLFLLS